MSSKTKLAESRRFSIVFFIITCWQMLKKIIYFLTAGTLLAFQSLYAFELDVINALVESATGITNRSLLASWQPEDRFRVCDKVSPVTLWGKSFPWQLVKEDVWEGEATDAGSALFLVSRSEQSSCTGILTENGQYYPALEWHENRPEGKIPEATQAVLLRFPEQPQFSKSQNDMALPFQSGGWNNFKVDDVPSLVGAAVGSFFLFPPKPPFPGFLGSNMKSQTDVFAIMAILFMAQSKLPFFNDPEQPLKKGYQDYLTLITSRVDDKVCLIGVIEGREKAKVKAFLKSIPGRLKRTITGICCDMYDGYVNAAGEALPKVPVMIDRFHVAKLYRKALVKVRQAELARLKKRLSPEDYQALKPSIAILKRNAEGVSKEERQELDKLKAAYRYCRKLTGIFNSKIGKEAASDRLEAWMAEVERSSLTQFDRFIKTLRKYKDQISNYFRKRETSGFVEGLNNKAKVTKRRCHGILSVKTFFQRLFLDTQGYDLFLGTQGLEAV